MTLLPPGWSEQHPMGGELARVQWRAGNDAYVSAAVLEAGGERVVRLWSGPGQCFPEATSAEELWALVEGLVALAPFLAAVPEPVLEPVEQGSLFDEVPA